MRQATFLACVIELGETGSSLKPTRCDDFTGNRVSGLRPDRARAGQGRGGGRPAKGVDIKFLIFTRQEL